MQDPFAQYVTSTADPFAAYAAASSQPSALDMITGRVGRDTNLSDSSEPDWKTSLNEAMQSTAHPQTGSDLGNLVVGAEAPAMVGKMLSPVTQGVVKYGGAVADLGTSFLPKQARLALGVLRTLSPTEWHSPLTVEGRGARAAVNARSFNDLPLAEQMAQMPAGGGVIRTRGMEPPNLRLGRETTAPVAAATPVTEAAAGALSPAERALLARRGYQPDLIARIEQRMAQQGQATPAVSHARPDLVPVGGEASYNATQATPVEARSAPQTPMEQVLSDQVNRPDIVRDAKAMQERAAAAQHPQVADAEPHPLMQPRVDMGARRAAQGSGLTTQDVRQATGPVLGETRGEASPILPKQALTRIIDDMRQLSPGAEREAYVARATSGKTQWQVENIRRTLEHLGLVVPAAVGVREGLMRLMSSHAPTSATTSGPNQ